MRVTAISAASPDMSEEEFREMKESIRKIGQLDPILVVGDQIFDGRKRARACSELGIEVKKMDYRGDDPETAAIARNILRTHYTPSQRALYAARQANATRNDAAVMRRDRATAKLQLHDTHTVGQVAKELGVSPRYVNSAKHVMRDGEPEVVEAVRTGKIKIQTAEAISRLARSEQPGALDRASKARGTNALSAAISGQKKTKRWPQKSPPVQMERTLQMIESAVEHLGTLRERFTESDLQTWADRMAMLRSDFSKVINSYRKGKK